MNPSAVVPWVRVGVDVGGTFTKAVAVIIGPEGAEIVSQSVRPTTHDASEGVAEGVVACVADVALAVGPGHVALVTHSTTQAVNALLEGDVGTVGVIGLGRRPELRRARERTALRHVELAAGRTLPTTSAFFDVTDGLPVEEVASALRAMRDAGVSAVCVAEAFAPDDASNETEVTEMATALGLPACASTELSGLYGLELRAVTSAVNASILPIALRTADFVARGVREAGIEAPVMVMRGDGGATDLEGFRKAPARTLYSGPAASVAGALRHSRINEGVVIEVGGTSTNVAAIRFGRPALSYVQVGSHATALRAVDVRVMGVAGGSLLRVRRNRIYGVGPRSAHIAGLGYACFTPVAALEGACIELIAPRIGDPADYVALRLRDNSRVGLTTTCAANALGVTEPDDYAWADPSAAKAASEIIGRQLRLTGSEVVARMMTAAGEAACELVLTVMRSQRLRQPTLVAVGGGAGGLGRYVASMLGLNVIVPEGAEVISSIGDALSLIRAERERTLEHLDPVLVRELLAEVEAEALAAGAAPGSLDVRLEEQVDKGTVRAIATGAVGLQSGAVPGRAAVSIHELPVGSRPVGAYFLTASGSTVTVLDRYGDPAAEITGAIVEGTDGLRVAIEHHTKFRGPVTLKPSVWVIDGARLMELTSGDIAKAAAEFAATAGTETFVVGRSR